MSTIPLPALNVHPPQQPESPLDAYGKMLQLKSMMQGQKLQGMQVEQAEADLKDQQTLRQAFIESGGDFEKTVKIGAAKGVKPQTIIGLQNSILESKQKYATLSKDQLANVSGKIKMADDSAQRVLTGKTPEDQAGIYAQERANLISTGQFTPEELPEQYPGPDFVRLHAAAANAAKKQISEVEEAQSKARTAESESQIKGAEAANLAQGGMTNAMADSKYRFLQQKLAQKQPISQADQGFITAYEKSETLKARTTINLQKDLLTDSGLDVAAEFYSKTGQLPTGTRSPAMASAIINRAAQLYPEADIAGNKAEYEANKDSLKALQKNRDAVVAFENTSLKNLDLFLKQAKGIVDSGSPMINTPLRQISMKGMGAADLAAFNAARQVAINEIAKVTSSPGLSGVLSDSARHEVEAFIPQNATLAQVYKVAEVLKQDMANRHESYDNQIAEIKARKPGAKPAEKPPAPGVIFARDPQGKLHQAPAGTALPQGWVEEKH